MTRAGGTKIIMGSHLTIAAKLSSDWGPPLTDLVLASVWETATTLHPLQFDNADYPIYRCQRLGGAIWGIPA